MMFFTWRISCSNFSSLTPLYFSRQHKDPIHSQAAVLETLHVRLPLSHLLIPKGFPFIIKENQSKKTKLRFVLQSILLLLYQRACFCDQVAKKHIYCSSMLKIDSNYSDNGTNNHNHKRGGREKDCHNVVFSSHAARNCSIVSLLLRVVLTWVVVPPFVRDALL